MEHRKAPIVCVSDGHAGNRRQAEALARALGHPEAPHLTLAPTRMARAFAPRLFPGDSRALGEGFQQLLSKPPMLAIGCGRQAALATRLLRVAGSRAVQILDPRLDPGHWDAVVAPSHDALSGANVVTLEGSLHPVDDLWLAQARHAFPRIGALPGPRVALLLGGPGRHWPMRDAALVEALSALATRVREAGGSLLATASRRTPARWLDALAALEPAMLWRDPRDGYNPYPGFLGWADAIVCSADSVNMLSEAAATHAPAWVIGRGALRGRPRHFLDALVASERIRDLEDGSLASPLVPAMPIRESMRVARELRTLLGLET